MKTLSRPMFRMGGAPSSDGVGITSGMQRRNYDSGAFGTIDEKIIEKGDQEKIIAELQKESLSKPKYGFSELISDAYQTSKGATDWRDWVNQASDKAVEYQQIEKMRPDKQLEMMKGLQKSRGEYYKNVRPLEIERVREYFDAGMLLVQDFDTWEDFSNSKEFAEWEFQMKRAMGNDFPGSFRVSELVLEEVRQQNEIRAAGGLAPLKGTALEDYKKSIVMQIYKRYLPDLQFSSGSSSPGSSSPGNAYGGKPIRRNYNIGMGPVMDENVQMSEQINTPQGDMSMTEDVNMMQQDPSTNAQDPYTLLRARLPQEIPDDVVRLIAYNPDAFADFANIETQEDIMAFNQQYGVELVLNTDQL
jgi:hypothetical protein